MVDAPAKLRTIRSFVLRQGRLTKGQERAFELFWPSWGIDYQDKLLDLGQLFGNNNPVTIEIGFGNGLSLAEMAKANPDHNYIGIEVHGPGVGLLLRTLDELGCSNVRICQHDAIEVLDHMIADNSVHSLQLYFPDPWHKKRHHKRRIVQRSFLEKIAHKIKSGGHFHVATDWQNYAEHILETLQASTDLFNNTSENNDYVPRLEYRPLTKFEQRGHRLGHGVWDLIFKRK